MEVTCWTRIDDILEALLIEKMGMDGDYTDLVIDGVVVGGVVDTDRTPMPAALVWSDTVEAVDELHMGSVGMQPAYAYMMAAYVTGETLRETRRKGQVMLTRLRKIVMERPGVFDAVGDDGERVVDLKYGTQRIEQRGDIGSMGTNTGHYLALAVLNFTVYTEV